MVCNLHFAVLELRLSTASAENAGSYSASQGKASFFSIARIHCLTDLQYFCEPMSFEVRKFDHFISYQCYFGTRRYFFNKPNFLRYLTDNRCCYDHPQVFYRTYRITLSIVYELKSIDYSGIFNSVLNDSIFMAHKLWPTSNEIIQFIVEHYNINRSI